MRSSSTYHRYIERPFTYPWGISKGTSRTWLYIGGPLSNGCALDNTTMDLSSHVPCVYREALLGFMRPYDKNPFGHLIGAIHREQHLGRLLRTCHLGSQLFRWGTVDPPRRVLLLDPAVYCELRQLENPSERSTIFNPSCHLSLLALVCLCVSFSFLT